MENVATIKYIPGTRRLYVGYDFGTGFQPPANFEDSYTFDFIRSAITSHIPSYGADNESCQCKFSDDVQYDCWITETRPSTIMLKSIQCNYVVNPSLLSDPTLWTATGPVDPTGNQFLLQFRFYESTYRTTSITHVVFFNSPYHSIIDLDPSLPPLPSPTDPICNQCNSANTLNCHPNNDGDKVCECKPTFGGLTCNAPLSQCDVAVSELCASPISGYVKFIDAQCGSGCTCYNQFLGPRCDSCGLECYNGGKPYRDCYRCGCASGYSGDHCQCRSVVGTIVLTGTNEIITKTQGKLSTSPLVPLEMTDANTDIDFSTNSPLGSGSTMADFDLIVQWFG